MPGRSRSATEERSSAGHGPSVTWWKSRRPLRGAGAVSNRKSARYSTEAPPPKSLEVEPGRLVKMTYRYLDDVIAHNQWMK